MSKVGNFEENSTKNKKRLNIDSNEIRHEELKKVSGVDPKTDLDIKMVQSVNYTTNYYFPYYGMPMTIHSVTGPHQVSLINDIDKFHPEIKKIDQNNKN